MTGESKGCRAGSALLVVKRGPNAGSRFLLDRPVTSAGRHADSDIVLDDITVSQHHAEFRREDRKFQVVDVDSLDGTYVNRELVDSAVLANGDEIQMGKFRLVFLPRHDGLTPRGPGLLRRQARQTISALRPCPRDVVVVSYPDNRRRPAFPVYGADRSLAATPQGSKIV